MIGLFSLILILLLLDFFSGTLDNLFDMLYSIPEVRESAGLAFSTLYKVVLFNIIYFAYILNYLFVLSFFTFP